MYYKDGTEAQVGDLVKGTVYNTKGVVVGTLLGITPGSTSCNARVAIVTSRGLGDNVLPNGRAPEGDDDGSPHVNVVLTMDGPMVVHREYHQHLHIASALLLGTKVDYTACDQLELVHRP